MRWLNRASVITHRPSGGIPPRASSCPLNTELIPRQPPRTPLIPEVATLTEATSNFSAGAAPAWALAWGAAKNAPTTNLPRLNESLDRSVIAASFSLDTMGGHSSLGNLALHRSPRAVHEPPFSAFPYHVEEVLSRGGTV